MAIDTLSVWTDNASSSIKTANIAKIWSYKIQNISIHKIKHRSAKIWCNMVEVTSHHWGNVTTTSFPGFLPTPPIFSHSVGMDIE